METVVEARSQEGSAAAGVAAFLDATASKLRLEAAPAQTAAV